MSAGALTGTATVDSGDIIDGQVKGVDVAESTLGIVPNAAKVGGLQVRKFNQTVTGYKTKTTIATVGTLKLGFECGEGPMGGGYVAYLHFNTTVDNAMFDSYQHLPTANPSDQSATYRQTDSDLDIAEDRVVAGSNGSVHATYRSPSGTVVTVDIEGRPLYNGPDIVGCQTWGTLVGG